MLALQMAVWHATQSISSKTFVIEYSELMILEGMWSTVSVKNLTSATTTKINRMSFFMNFCRMSVWEEIGI